MAERREILRRFAGGAAEFSTRCCGELHLTVLSSQRVENSPPPTQAFTCPLNRGRSSTRACVVARHG
jgi:hypothetical protein